MKKCIYTLICFIAANTCSYSQTIIAGDSTLYYQDLFNENLPLIVINTVDEEEPTFDYVETPEGNIGSAISNATKVPGQMYIILGNDTLYDSGVYEDDTSGITIKVRGNSSANYPKKSYKIKLQKKADLLCRGNDDVYKDKEWVLLRNDNDLTSNMTGFRVSELMNFAWTPSFEYANVVMNGIYRGIYLLSESIKMNSNCRIDVDENCGYIIENDPYYWNEDLYFDSSFAFNYTFKYPESKDVTEEQLEYIQNAMNITEASLDDGSYPKYIDVNSFANWVLTHDLLGTYDEAGSNMFISKYNNTTNSKFKMETPWDFDTIEQTPDDWSNIHKSIGFFYCKLFGNSNQEFEKEYIKVWREKGNDIVERIIDYLDNFEHSDLAAALDYYSPLDRQTNQLNYASITEQMETSKQWFIDRKAWLDDAITKLEKEIIFWLIPYSYPTNNNAIYDLQGRRVLNPTRGVYILNGKKHIVK
ncbi:MAG: CotH kinase family protein [Prevotella sp.]|nr:CotH kinase family protein [Prevotella sp.]